jgi:hypothetical protein
MQISGTMAWFVHLLVSRRSADNPLDDNQTNRRCRRAARAPSRAGIRSQFALVQFALFEPHAHKSFVKPQGPAFIKPEGHARTLEHGENGEPSPETHIFGEVRIVRTRLPRQDSAQLDGEA